MSTIKLKVTGDTFFKQKPIDSRDLEEGTEKVFIKSGTEFIVHSYDSTTTNDHLRIAFKNTFLGTKNLTTWYVYNPHINLIGTEDGNNPKDDTVPAIPLQKKQYTGTQITLAGLGQVYLSQPVIPNGHFNWGEVTKNGRRIPVNKDVVDNIIRIAKVMEEVRTLLGNKSITVTSWYRDPATNRRVGGSSRSRHIQGDAVDFRHSVLSPQQVLSKLDPWWGSKGGLASGSGFTHIDARRYRARWRY